MGSGRPLRFAGIELHQLTKARIGFVRNPPGIGTFKVRDGGCFVIEILKNFPDNVVAISCSGQVTKEDYDRILVPAILKALKQMCIRDSLIGDVTETILDRAAQWRADLITVSSQGQRSIHDLFLGNVAESVARRAGCSVAIVRPPVSN